MAISKKYKIKTQPSGAYAANLLGISEQVPRKMIFLTEGEGKKLMILDYAVEKLSKPMGFDEINRVVGQYCGKPPKGLVPT